MTPSEKALHFPDYISWRQKEANIKAYDEATKHSFTLGQYVYLDPPAKSFDKSYD
jgi:hypothetical protein